MKENNIKSKDNINIEKKENLGSDIEKFYDNDTKIITKNTNKSVKIIKIISYFVIGLFFLVFIVQYISADKYEAIVNVLESNEIVGVNPTSEKLDYGDLPKGKRLTRSISINNNGNMPILIVIVKTGNIAELIKINKNNFVLNSGKKNSIEFLLSLPISADKKNYNGKIIVFKIPKLI